MKHTPSLAFVLDAIPENARHIEEVLDRARMADEQVHHIAEHATFAGEPDPYRHADSDGDEA